MLLILSQCISISISFTHAYRPTDRMAKVATKWVAVRITNYVFIYLDKKNGNIINKNFEW